MTSPGTATINCIASGLPTPDITWTSPGGTELLSDQNNIEIVNMGVDRTVMSTLRIPNTSPSVSGRYTCSASNGAVIPEAVTSATAELTVHGKFGIFFWFGINSLYYS